ncbi:MAG: hypothetical protein K2X98_04595 [Alphaproteobacteria bacterium]|nr:hypothetical protein [Alphaproteobacteria bacterium]
MKSVLLIDIKDGNERYNSLVQSAVALLDAQGVHYTKLSVSHLLEAPIALRFAVETFRSTSDRHMRKPDGYMVLGFVPITESFESVVYEEVLRSLQDMACYYGLALSHHTCFESREGGIDAATIAERTLYSCLNLIHIKKQFGLQTNHISTP